MTNEEKYDPAMRILTQDAADAYFEMLVKERLKISPDLLRIQAEEAERQNLGYWAGYGTATTRARVERLFKCCHPILPPAGSPQPSAEELFMIGLMKVRSGDPMPWPTRSGPFE
jgi:hypothetical protein